MLFQKIDLLSGLMADKKIEQQTYARCSVNYDIVISKDRSEIFSLNNCLRKSVTPLAA